MGVSIILFGRCPFVLAVMLVQNMSVLPSTRDSAWACWPSSSF